MANQTLTWGALAQKAGEALAKAKNEQQLEAVLDQIEQTLAGHTIPTDFWDRVADVYAKAPKPLIKEAAAAAALNALVLSAQARILARKK